MLDIDVDDGTIADFDPVITPIALKAAKRKGQDPDLPTFQDAMTGPYREHFERAIIKEIRDLERQRTWIVVPLCEVPKDATWVLRIKRLPNGEFSKFKARLCVRGDLQDEFRETYAPVVKWSTIRIVLTFVIKHSMKTRQIDFANAFVQALLPVTEQIYLQLPKGFTSMTPSALKLQKSLYGLVRAPYHWFQMLKSTLVDLGFTQSKQDQCLFINTTTKVIVLVYTDDCLCFAFDDQNLDSLIAQLQVRHKLDEQEITMDVYGYLGIQLDTRGPMVEMLQTGLIEKILKTVGLNTCTPNATPAKEQPLHRDAEGEPFDEVWDYSSVVGMLMYLVNTRPDIQFAVHQCAKYAHYPRKSHGNAVKKICRYLQGTKHKGLRFSTKPILGSKIGVNCYGDASFAPLWDIESAESSEGAKSRTGYIIRLDDCPVTWSSKQQGEVALSTTEAEYVALSTAMRELIWIRRIVDEVATSLQIPYSQRAVINSRVFEDNQGAIHVANHPDLTPRTRHIHTKYHHFKENIGLDENGNGITLEYINRRIN